MPKCSCGVVSGDCYDACGARESKISSLIAERDAAVADALRWRNCRTLDRDSVMKMVIEEGPFFRATDRDAYIDQFAARKEGGT